MLVRCKHCSTVYPSDGGKCPKCKTPYTPPPKPPAPSPASIRAATMAARSAVLGGFFAILFFIVGRILISKTIAPTLGLILCLIAAACIVVATIAMIKMMQMHDANAEQRESMVSPEEYEQRIRDFINHHQEGK